MFENSPLEKREINPNEDRVELSTDFRGNYFISKIYEDDNPRTSNYELFHEEYLNHDSQEIFFNLPELEPCSKYEIRFKVIVDWNYEHTECDAEIHYIKDSIRKLDV